MLISQEILKTVGFLDPAFRAPGWGSDADYCHRVWMPGLELYVSHRAILWHHGNIGGLSATEAYGDRSKWVAKGLQQATEDLRTKYGLHWRDVLPLASATPTSTNTAGTQHTSWRAVRRTHIRRMEGHHRPR
ncbi:MAG: hypothetical protein ACI8P0_001733 [Planctomycetaceae bacterium]|jgi:hypothetical protein